MGVSTPLTINNKDHTIPLLLLAATGSIVFTCISTLFVYDNTQRLVASHDWRDHSQEILATLQSTSQRLDRIDYTSRLYLLAKNEDDLAIAQSTAIVLGTGVVHLQELVKDSQPQRERAQHMYKCVQDLKRQINDTLLQNTSVSKTVLECRDEVSKMQEFERTLLASRIADSRYSTSRSLMASVFFQIISLAVVITLFGILLQNTRKRREADRQISDTNSQLESTIQTLRKHAADARLLTSAREELQLSTIPEQAQKAAVRYCKQLLPAVDVALLSINNSRQIVEITAASKPGMSLLDGFAIDSCCGLRSGRPRFRKPGHSEIHCSHFVGKPPENYLCIPLTAHGETLGVLYLEPSFQEVADQIESHMESVEELAEMASMSIASLNLRVRLEHQSIRDGLTGLFNRHFMEISLDREIRRAVRKESDLAILMLDIDHFKLFNDTYGHEAGDLILRSVADIFRRSVRAEDVVCRYGGEEFVLILPETSQPLAVDRAEDIRRQVSDNRIRFRDETLREITISVGVAVYPQCGVMAEELLRAADRALYAAKHRGRNQVVIATEASVMTI